MNDKRQDMLSHGELVEELHRLRRRVEELEAAAQRGRQTEEALRHGERKLAEAMNIGHMGYWEYDVIGQTIDWSKNLYRLYQRDPALGPPTLEQEAAYYPPEQIKKLRAYAQKAIETGREFEYDFQVNLPNGDVRDFSSSMRSIKDRNGTVIRLFGVVQDITTRKESEQKIMASLKEKEILLQEVHHRVKNNLAVISSILGLQSAFFQDPRVLNVFRDCQHRIQSMALVHGQLYRARDLSNIDFPHYVRQLTTGISRATEFRGSRFNLVINVEPGVMDIDTAIPCGLIINELVTNAFKYAFPDNSGGTVHINGRLQDNQYQLVISDDGVGLPGDIDIQNPDTLGLQLVGLLTRQLEGHLEVNSHNGTTFRLTFPGTTTSNQDT